MKPIKPLYIPTSKPKHRIGVLPTRTERSDKDRERERNPKHRHRRDSYDSSSEYGYRFA